MPRRFLPANQVLPPQDAVTLEPTHVQQVRTLLAEAQALSTRLAALNEVAVAMQSDLKTDEILHTFAREARWVIDFQICSFALRSGPSYTVEVLRGAPGAQLINHALGSDAISRVLENGQALLINQPDEDDKLPVDMQSALLLPLRHAGRVVGSVHFYTVIPNAYTLDDVRIAYALAVQVGVILHNARLLDDVTQAHNELFTILESISDAVLVITLQGTVLLTNSSLRRMLKLNDVVLTGQHVRALLRQLRRKPHRLMNTQLLRDLRQQWHESAGGHLRLDGRTIEWAGAPLTELGVTIGFVYTARDISDRIELEQFRDAMVGMLVHDLRTPLTSLMLGLDFLLLDNIHLSGADTTAVLRQSRTAATRLMTLISTILDVRKLQAGKMELALGLVFVVQLYTQATTSVRATLDDQQQQLVYEIADDAANLEADSVLLLRVVENLLSNAAKFSPLGETITLATQRTNTGAIELSVADRGPGVPEGQRTRIFEMFGQVHGGNARQGTGLGLTFCKLAIEAHGGTIGVRARPGGGSVFWCVLPG